MVVLYVSVDYCNNDVCRFFGDILGSGSVDVGDNV